MLFFKNNQEILLDLADFAMEEQPQVHNTTTPFLMNLCISQGCEVKIHRVEIKC